MTSIEDQIRDIILSGIPSERELLKMIRDNYTPDEIFAKNLLEEWATENGYVLT